MNGAMRTIARLTAFALGGLRVALGRAHGDDARATVLSSDVFATLIARHSDDNAAMRAGTLTFVRLARAAGLVVEGDGSALRLRTEAKLSAERRAAGADPDFTHAALFTQMAEDLGAADAAALGAAAAAAEADWELRLTRPVGALRDWYRAALDQGRRVIAISDTRYSEAELRSILTAHGYDRLAQVYCSSDHGANKFSGRLFDIVSRAEGVTPRAFSHRGDSWPGDVLSPASRGLGVMRVGPPPQPVAAAPLPLVPCMVDPGDPASQPYTVGFTVLGPVFAAFVRLVLAQAYADGITHLAFVARDGDLPMQVTRILVEALPETWRPRISYVYLSRRSLAGVIDDRGQPTAYGDRVRRYLAGAGVLDVKTALVDIGWRGSTHQSIRVLAEASGDRVGRAYYLGLWNEDALPAEDDRVCGILSDQRRHRGPREGAGWFAALLLEGVARAEHGTVIGFDEGANGIVEPILAESGVMRDAELASQQVQRDIRKGVLDHAHALARLDGISAPPDPRRTRAAAQRLLFRLAFFPDARERAVGRRLVHTESTDDFIASLVQAPSSGLTGRLRALRSPWKGAGFVEVGGHLAAGAYLIVETAFCYLPLGLKTRLRDRMGAPPNDAPAQGAGE